MCLLQSVVGGTSVAVCGVLDDESASAWRGNTITVKSERVLSLDKAVASHVVTTSEGVENNTFN